MPRIPFFVRVLLLTVGFLATLAAPAAPNEVMTLALCGVGVLGLTTSIDWIAPLPSALATALTGFPVAIGLFTVMAMDSDPRFGHLLIAIAVILGFWITACFAWALAGHTLRTTPRRRWLIASAVSAALVAVPALVLWSAFTA